MASPAQWTWVWVNSGWWTGRPGAVHRIAKSWTRLSHWTELNCATTVTGTSSNHCQRAIFPMRHSLLMTVSPEAPLSHTAISYPSSQYFPSVRAQFCWSPFSSVSLGTLMLSTPLWHRIHCVLPSVSNLQIWGLYNTGVSVTQLCLTFHDFVDFSPLGSSVHEIFQARIQEWVSTSFSRRSSWVRDGIQVCCIGRGVFATEPPGKSKTGAYVLPFPNSGPMEGMANRF